MGVMRRAQLSTGPIFSKNRYPLFGISPSIASVAASNQEIPEYLETRKRTQFLGINEIGVELGRCAVGEQLHDIRAFRE